MAHTADQFTYHFTKRADDVLGRLTTFGASFAPETLTDLADADDAVTEQVQAVLDAHTPPTDQMYRDLADKIVAGKLKPGTALAKLDTSVDVPAPGGHSRLDVLAATVAFAARRKLDRPEFSPAALRGELHAHVSEQLHGAADDMVTTIAKAPERVRARLSQVVEHSRGTAHGDHVGRALDYLGDLKATTGRDLDATRAVVSAWQFAGRDRADIASDLHYLATGRPADQHADTFDADLMFTPIEFAPLVAAGVPLSYLVAAGHLDALDVLVDPFGTDTDAYAARVEVGRAFTGWHRAAADHRAYRLNVPDDLKRRERMAVVDAFQLWRETDGADVVGAA